MPEHPTKHSSISAVLAAIGLSALLIVLLREGLSASGIGRYWGFDFFADTRRDVFPWRIGLLLPLVAFILKPVYARVIRNEARIRTALPLLLVVAAMAVLFLWPMRTFFYGDGGPLLVQIWRIGEQQAVDMSLLLNWKSSPLAGALIYGLAVAVPKTFSAFGLPLPTHAAYPFVAMSALALIALGVYFFMRRRDERTVMEALLLFGTAGALFFFGYVEFYLPVFVFVFLYLSTAERALDGGSLWPSALALALAIAAHYAAAVLLPSFAVLALSRNKESRIRISGSRVLLVLGGAVALYLALLFGGVIGSGDSRLIMPLHPVDSPAGRCVYTVFSSWHLADFANLLALLAALPLLVIAALAFTRQGRSWFSTTHFAFHALGSGLFFLFIFAANTSLGLARDWDLAAPLGLLLAFFALSMLRHASGKDWPRSGHLFALSAMLLTLPWLAINLNADLSAKRFERVLALDAEHMYRDYALSGYEALRKYHQNAGHRDRDLELSRKKILIIDYPSNYLSLFGKSQYMLEAGLRTDYIATQRWMLERLARKARELRTARVERDYAIGIPQIDSLAELIAVHAFISRTDSALGDTFRDVGDATGYAYPFLSIRGMEAYQRREYPAAAELLQQALNRGFHSARVYVVLGTALGLADRHGEALRAFEAGVLANPADMQLHVLLAKYYIRAGVNLQGARVLLERAMNLEPDPTQQREIQGLVEQIGGP
ncbi:MAG: hypothetical protein IPP94_16155 [Ignavibacteria bacterium]|nr:hypothetical protein [Ignavibacteria bacterium]